MKKLLLSLFIISLISLNINTKAYAKDDFKENFIEGCVEGIEEEGLPLDETYCVCVYNKLMKKYGKKEFMRINLLVATDDNYEPPEEYATVAAQCMLTSISDD